MRLHARTCLDRHPAACRYGCMHTPVLETICQLLVGTPRRRWGTALSLLAVALFLAYGTSWVPALRGIVRGPDGLPVPGACVVYHHFGSIPLPTPHPSHHAVYRGAGVTTTDEEGRFVIPGRLHLFCPTMNLQLRCIYSSRLHSSKDERRQRTGVVFSHLPSPLPGHLVGWLSHADFAAKEYEVTLSESADVAAWLASLDQLQRATIKGDCEVDLGRNDRIAVTRALLDEYRALLDRQRSLGANAARPDMDASDRWRQQSAEEALEVEIRSLEAALSQ